MYVTLLLMLVDCHYSTCSSIRLACWKAFDELKGWHHHCPNSIFVWKWNINTRLLNLLCIIVSVYVTVELRQINLRPCPQTRTHLDSSEEGQWVSPHFCSFLSPRPWWWHHVLSVTTGIVLHRKWTSRGWSRSSRCKVSRFSLTPVLLSNRKRHHEDSSGWHSWMAADNRSLGRLESGMLSKWAAGYIWIHLGPLTVHSNLFKGSGSHRGVLDPVFWDNPQTSLWAVSRIFSFWLTPYHYTKSNVHPLTLIKHNRTRS